MKGNKIYVALLALLAVLLLSAPAWAVITGTAHNLTTGNRSQCSVCHIPHGGQGARLWPVAPVTGANFVGTVSTLCATCHLSTGAMNAIGTGQAPSDNFVYNTNSHGVQMTRTQIPAGTGLTSSALPYTGDGTQTAPQGPTMECTSCHDVHNDQTNRPFLRASVQTLCVRCHIGRNFQSGTDVTGTANWGAWGANIRATNPGSHPVGTDITGDVTVPGNSPITFPNEAQVQITATAGDWHIGGHRAIDGDTGGVACVTCHAVHGVRIDSGASETNPPATNGPNANMLLMAQRSTGDEGEGTGRSVANGNEGFDRACEACHAGPAPTGYSSTVFRPNPGGTNDTHPVDDMVAQYDAGVTSFFGGAANVPVGGTNDSGPAAGTNVNPIPICESCHTPHGAVNDSARASITATGRAFALRDGMSTLCAQCHTGTIAGHHPVSTTAVPINIATALSGPASYLTIGTNISLTTLECGTCHNGAGAHNWANSTGIGLNPNWRPLNNARDNVAANERFVGDGTAANRYPSTTCVDCHLGNTGDVNPSNHAIPGETAFNDLGEGSHYIGPFPSTFFAPHALRPAATTVAIGGTTGFTWPAGGWSRFGGTSAAPVLICESCHELEPDKNGGAATPHLVLYRYVEGEAANQQFSAFCEGCHGVPAGTHPMTSDTVGRTNAALSTVLTGRPWLAAAAPTNTPGGGIAGTSTWAANEMSCDSCHQPHSANTTGGTLILEAPWASGAGNVTGGTTVATTMAGTNVSGNIVSNRISVAESVGATPNYSRFCDQCHTYLQ